MNVRRTALLMAALVAVVTAAVLATVRPTPAGAAAESKQVCVGLHGSDGWDTYCLTLNLPD